MQLRWLHPILCGFFFLFSHAMVMADTLTARIDRDQISLEDTINLQISYDGRSSDSPNLDLLESSFDILQRSQSSSFSVTNGRAISTTQWHFVLAPKSAGQLLIPPFEIDGTTSKGLNVTVTEQGQAGVQAGGKDVFLETTANKTTAFVQEQIRLSFKLYYAVSLSNLEPHLFQLPDVRTTELPRKEYTTMVGHREYNVMEFVVAVSTDKSGEITLPSLRWTVHVDDPASSMLGFRSGRSTIQRLNTDEVKLTIKPRPAEFPASATWLPAQDVKLSQSWSQSPDQFKVGEPITRTLTLTAEGAGAEQLPSLVPPTTNDELRYYPDKPELNTQASDAGLSATRTETVAIVPNKPGTLSLPAVKIFWWNTTANRLQTAELPEQIIMVAETTVPTNATGLPNVAGVDAAPVTDQKPCTQANPIGISIYIAGGLTLSNVLFAWLWWRQRSRQANSLDVVVPKPPTLTADEHFRALQQACTEGDAKHARDSLVHWAAASTGKRISQLTQVADWLDDANLRSQLNLLDKCLFGNEFNAWQGETLLQRLQDWRQKHKSRGKHEDADLDSLY